MANHISSTFVILVLVAAVGNIALAAVHELDACSQPMGACGPIGDCDQRCKALHSDGEGSCDLGLCTCYYGCPSPPSPSVANCTGGLGLCTAECWEDCCNAKCAKQFNQGVGSCNEISNYYLCTCYYVCSS